MPPLVERDDLRFLKYGTNAWPVPKSTESVSRPTTPIADQALFRNFTVSALIQGFYRKTRSGFRQSLLVWLIHSGPIQNQFPVLTMMSFFYR